MKYFARKISGIPKNQELKKMRIPFLKLFVSLANSYAIFVIDDSFDVGVLLL